MLTTTIIGYMPSATTSPAPEINCWIPEENTDEIGIIIFPGGGYEILSDYEGAGYADHFSKLGIACFVVTYRLGSQQFRHPAMLEDALAAVYTLRSKAQNFGINPTRLGVMGSSAGGHLAAHTLTAWNRYSCDILLRPDFGILCYPLILMNGIHSHEGSVINLLGKNPSKELIQSVSCDQHVTSDTPPCFIWHTADDPVVSVESSIQFATALNRNKISFEQHIYAHGPHGIGLRTDLPWAEDCIRWLKTEISGKTTKNNR